MPRLLPQDTQAEARMPMTVTVTVILRLSATAVAHVTRIAATDSQVTVDPSPARPQPLQAALPPESLPVVFESRSQWLLHSEPCQNLCCSQIAL